MNTVTLECYSEEARDSDKGIRIKFLDSWKRVLNHLKVYASGDLCLGFHKIELKNQHI